MKKSLLIRHPYQLFERQRKSQGLSASHFEESTMYCSVISIAEIHAGMKEHEKEKNN